MIIYNWLEKKHTYSLFLVVCSFWKKYRSIEYNMKNLYAKPKIDFEQFEIYNQSYKLWQ